MSTKINVGVIDRVLRLGVSVVLFYLAFFFPATADDTMVQSILIGVGAIFTVVALIGICPVYMLIGVSTAPKPEAE